MNCERFDADIANAFTHYGPLGVHVQLYGASDHPISIEPGDQIDVTLVVAPVVQHPVPQTVIWHFSGLIYQTTQPGVPLGVLPIDRKRLVGACAAAKKLPPGFPLKAASCHLFWPLVPGAHEPAYTFAAEHGDQTTVIRVGAYSGKVEPHAELAGHAS